MRSSLLSGGGGNGSENKKRSGQFKNANHNKVSPKVVPWSMPGHEN